MKRLSVGAMIMGLLSFIAGCGKGDGAPGGEAGGSGAVAGASGAAGEGSGGGSSGAAGGENGAAGASSGAAGSSGEAGGPSSGGGPSGGGPSGGGPSGGGPSGGGASGGGEASGGGGASGGAAGVSGGTAGTSAGSAGMGAGAAGAPQNACRPITTVELTGTPTRIFSAADKVEQYHLPDGVFDAYSSRDADGQGLMISLNLPGSENYRMRGPSLLELASDRNETFSSASSAEDPSEAAYNYRHWITGTYTLDGTTVYAIAHHEWYGCLLAGDCAGDRQTKSWVSSLTHFTSTDGGATWMPTGASPAAGHVVVHPQLWPAYPYDGQYYNHYGMFMPSGLVRDGDHFYSAFWYLHRTGDGPTGIERQGISLVRTRDISRASGWEVLNAAGQYESLATAQEPFGLIHSLVWGSHSQVIVYDKVACQYVLFFTPADREDVVEYSVSTTLSAPSWSTPAAIIGSETLAHDGYVGIVDPASEGLNFEFVAEEATFFYAVTDPADVFSRELYRQPLRIGHAP